MALSTTHKKEVQEKTFERDFFFEGNRNGATIETSSNPKNDGDINSSKDRTTFGIVDAQLQLLPNEKKVRLSLNYRVEEKGGDGTLLYFKATQDYSIEQFYNEGVLNNKIENDGKVIKNCTPIIELSGHYRKAYVVSSFKGGHYFQKPDPWNRDRAKYYVTPKGMELLPDETLDKIDPYYRGKLETYTSVSQPWLPVKDLMMKIDGPGKDLTAEGNIAIKGKVVFTIRRVDDIEVITKTDDELPPEQEQTATLPQPTYGSEKKVDDLPEIVDGVLGRGYNICGTYADSDMCSSTKVLDIEKLNQYNRILYKKKNTGFGRVFEGEGQTEYTSSIEKDIKLSASIGIKGVAFSSQVSQSFNQEESEKTTYKYLTQLSGNMKCQYLISYYSPSQLIPFLHNDFLTALNTLPPDKFIEHFGTHVLLGMGIGTKFFFNMKYKEYVRKMSTATTFESTSKISYLDNGKIEKPEKPSNDGPLTFQTIHDELVAGTINSDQANALSNILKAIYETGSKQGGASQGAQGLGGPEYSFSAEASFQETLKQTLRVENKSTEINCFCLGGKSSIAQKINGGTATVKDYDEWTKSGEDMEECVFCDFVNNSLLPIYELIPEGFRLTPQNVKKAYEDHLFLQDRHQKENVKHGVKYVPFHTEGSSNTDLINSDEDMYTKSNKEVWWSLHVYLLNFENGRCGFGITLVASEGGSNQAKTVFKNQFTREIDLEDGCKDMAIDTDSLGGSHEFSAEATWIGEFHGWHDATNDVLNGTAGRVLCCNGKTVEIMLDDKGKDNDHVGVKGTIMIPWIGY